MLDVYKPSDKRFPELPSIAASTVTLTRWSMGADLSHDKKLDQILAKLNQEPDTVASGPRLFVAERPHNVSMPYVWPSYGAEPCFIVDQRTLPAGAGFEAFYAPRNYRGFAALDYEFSTDDKDAAKRVAAINSLRGRWPDAEIGVYAAPVVYWHPVESRPMRVEDIEHPALKVIEDQWKPVADASDFVCVSCYDLYGDPENHAQTFDSEAVKAALRWAKRFGKPVHAWVWRRYHDSNAALKFKLIDAAEYTAQVQAAASEADAITIWGYDEGWVRTNVPEFMARFNAEKPAGVRDELWLDYLNEEAVALTAKAMGRDVVVPAQPGGGA